MEFPENISELTLSEAQSLVAQIDERLEEVNKTKELIGASLKSKTLQDKFTLADVTQNRDELADLTAKRAELKAALVSAGLEDDEDESSEDAGESEETSTDEESEEATEEAEEASEEAEEEATETAEGKAEEVEATAEVEAEAEETKDLVDTTEASDETVAQEDTATEEVVEENGEATMSDDINESTEGAENVGTIAASYRPVVDGATDTVEAVQKVKIRTNGGEAFKRVIETDNKFISASHNVQSTTDFIMSLGTPGRENELSFAQKQWAKSNSKDGLISAAFCQPPQLIDSDIQCGSYNREILSLFPTFIMEGLEVELFTPIDVEDQADYVGQVNIDDSSIEKSCYDAGCLTRVSYRADEIKACLQANEQTAFTNAAGIRALLADGEALLAALGDELLLEKILDETHKMEWTAGSAGYGEAKVAVAVAFETLARQSKIKDVTGLGALVPRSFLSYAIGDNAVRQFSTSQADEAASEVLSGLGLAFVRTYQDAIDITDDRPVPSLSKVSSLDLNAQLREDWSIHLIDPADGFVGLRDENEYSIQPVPQSITELRANRLSWFARAYELFGKRGCTPWGTVELTGLCLGGRVIAQATCIEPS